jgi:hypothetical protein
MRRAPGAVARTAFLVLGCAAFLCGCASDSSDEPSSESTQALATNPGGGTGRMKSCKDSHGECHLGCDATYPWSKDGARTLISEYRSACQSSCDADYQRCKEPAARQAP